LNDWWDVARGLVPPDDASSKLAHAGRCGYCSRILREILDDAGAEVATDDPFVHGLPSSQPDAMREQARRFVQAGLPAGRRWARPALRGWLIAAALVVAAVTGTMVMRRQAADRVNGLLAQAYAENRPSELRFPGAQYGPIRQQRGGGTARSASVMEAEIPISKGLSRDPNDYRLLQMKGRADLLEWRYDDAIDVLERARTASPGDSSVLADLAAAYFERAQAHDNRADYSMALDLFSTAIEREPKSPVLRFNRAVTLGHLSLGDRAIDEWKEFLRLEPGGEWANEARMRLAEATATPGIQRELRPLPK
jgi:tetratricopeptide (TPR) repeat protein